MAPPAVSVLMPVYNAGPYLAEAVESVLGQTFADFELVVVDDGSTDDSPAVLARYAADRRMTVARQPNAGITAARLALVGRAAAPLIAMMDADDVARPDRLAVQVEYLRANPDVVLVGSRYGYIDGAGNRLGAPAVPTDHADIDAWHMSGRGCVVHQSTVVFRRAAYDQAGGYSADFPQAEDFDLWLRLAERGRLAVVEPELVQYRIHAASAVRRDPGGYDRAMGRAVRAAVVRRGYDLGRVPFDALDAATQLDWIDRALAVGDARTAGRWAARRFLRAPGWRTGKTLAKAVLGRSPAALAWAGRVRAAVRRRGPV